MLLAAGLFCALGCLVGGLFINVAMGFPMEIGRVLRTPIPTDRGGTTSPELQDLPEPVVGFTGLDDPTRTGIQWFRSGPLAL